MCCVSFVWSSVAANDYLWHKLIQSFQCSASKILRETIETECVLLQVFRRFQWMFVRLEVELRKIQALSPELVTLVPPAHAPVHSKVDVQHILATAPSEAI